MKARWIPLATGTILLSLILASWAMAPPMLVLREPENQRILFQIPFPYGETFTIRYIHSVNHTPVFEVFRAVKGKGLVLVETYFRMFGAGMGHWEGHGIIVQDGEWTKIEKIDRVLGGFLLRVGSYGVNHTLLYQGNEWSLTEMAAGRRVEVLLSEKEPCRQTDDP